ncbi:plastocyanin/azurin family copper-binding protein [Carboxydochorda subterranea]|uniref:Plastocyanin/azurin family copper-binding protein n=1 Tax=Carboxydichorda subterranea TaxID=3109565 RepID=A0ABZ1BXI1_9FIRM|nr:plastocyanin/azurin family copper-binding protein [Limnochorda sp. L945t]WRP17515.1 plastocyanin/azurin family copper-binding protein [Limnochorda sp. L945t]
MTEVEVPRPGIRGMGIVAAAVTVVLGLAAGALAAESGHSDEPSAGAGGTTLVLEMGDYHFTPSRITLKPGQTYHLVVRNRGTTEHELMIGRGLVTSGGTHSFRTNFFSGVEVLLKAGEAAAEVEDLGELEVEPGGEASLDFTVPADHQGDWEMACLVPGHYELGMHGTVTVR